MTPAQICPRSRTAGRQPPTSRWCGGRGSPTSATLVMTWWDRTRSRVSWTSPGARSPPSVKRVSPQPLSCKANLHQRSTDVYCDIVACFSVMYCSDPGHVEHSTRALSDPKLLVGTTIQYSCNPGFVLQGGATITCYGREPGTPVWTSGLPHCVCECQNDPEILFPRAKHE